MIRKHLRGHGQSYQGHFLNNWLLTRIAIKSALYTFGHGVFPRISGWRASQLHNELWNRGRALSIEDLTHRLSSGFYADKTAALNDYREYADLYSETQVMGSFVEFIERHYADPIDSSRC